MDPDSRNPARGRARGRARNIAETQPPPDPVGTKRPRRDGEEEEEEENPESLQNPLAYRGMFSGSPECPESQGDDNDNGNGGNGSSSGNGNGNGDNGRDRSSPSERGLPRGALQGGEQSPEEPLTAIDYVESRPARDFVKQGGGPQDRRVVVISNYYSFRQKPDFQFKLYHVKIEPPVEEVSKVRRIVAQKREEIGPYLLSGFKMFRTGPFTGEDQLCKNFMNINLNPDQAESENYNVTLEFIRDVDNSEALVFQFYNIVCRKMQSMLDLRLLGRYFYNPDQKREFGVHKLELWPGFQNSIRQQEQNMLLNVECVWKVLQTENVFEKMKMIRANNPDGFDEECRQTFVGAQVVTNYNKKAYKIESIDFSKKPTHTFPLYDKQTKQEKEISYIDYYRKRYNTNIKATGQPLLKTKPTKSDIRRGQTEGVYLIPELCWLSGLNENMRSNFKLMKDLAVCLHMQPTDRVNTMQAFVDKVANRTEIREELKRWGCLLNKTPVEFEARCYPPEELVFADGRREKADDKADWTFAMRKQRMLTTMKLERWAVVVGGRDAPSIGNLVNTMQRVATPLGYNIARPTQVVAVNGIGAGPYSKAVNDAIQKLQGKLDMMFVVLPNNNADTYAAVKKHCSIQFGIPSQCFLAKHLGNAKGLMSICTKLVIQMNAKQGGEPWGAVIPLKDMMVLGYDVHHAGPGGGASYGAMTATTNATYGRYYSCVEQQTERSEIYTHVVKMFYKCLMAYNTANGGLPKRIIMYRDGVGEGQLQDVYLQELKGFEEKIAEVYGSMDQPKITYIVVNKRINTRFFMKVGQSRFENPKPGLVVDDVVTRPERYDFFLISQIARQGCVSPTYYNVLKDTSGLPPDKVQRLTYKFCHMYFNWTGTVAVPAPCQNAHKLALLTGTALKAPAHKNLSYLLHFL